MKLFQIDIQCQALHSSGKRCKRKALYLIQYHGDGEIYGYDGPEPSWVLVYLCGKHVDLRNSLKRKDKP